nr:fasciclin domain-containing protein [uncultured Arsenicibacter sp.]
MKITENLYRLRYVTMALLGAVMAASVSCSKEEEPVATQSVADIINTNTSLSLTRVAIQRAGLTSALGGSNVTIFAPSDAAFQAAGYADAAAINNIPDTTLRRMLQYHVVASKVETFTIPFGNNSITATSGLTPNGTLYLTKDNTGVSVNAAHISQADLMATNGVVHVIDRVLMPPTATLARVITSQPSTFSLLAAAATRADSTLLTSLNSSTAVVTLFAPTNAAFEAAGLNAAAIQKATPAQLTKILTYHAVPGRVFSTNLSSGKITTLQSGTATVTVGANTITVLGAGNNGAAATVTRPNVMATNGIIHVIDKVLMPAQ